jgi:hypothetical protein
VSEWDQVPDLIVPMGTAGYIGWGIVALLGYALLIAAAVLYDRLAIVALIVAVLGTIPLGMGAFHYLRTVEMGWNWPNVGVWAGLIAGECSAPSSPTSSPVRRTRTRRSAPHSLSGGVVVAGFFAGALDGFHERLANFPISPQGFFGLVVLGVVALVAFIHWARNN